MPQLELNLQILLDRLRDIGRKIPDVPCVYPLKEPTLGVGIPQSDIDFLESIIKATLPEDFVLFQKRCGFIEAMDIWNGYSLMEASHIKTLILDPHSPRVMQVTSTGSMIPIGGDGSGNIFLMVFDGSGHISKWNHESGRQERLADTFVGFLERMLEDWQHFVVEDGHWEYMAG